MKIAARRRLQWMLSCPPGLEQRRIEFVSGRPVEVVRIGRGEPVVMVPGLAGGWPLLVPLARRLARHHEVILYSFRGDRNPSEVGGGRHRMGEYVGDLAALIEHLGLERPTLLGVSFGGAVALETALESPRHAGALVLQGVEARFRASLGATIARSVLERYPLPKDNRFVNQFFNLLYGGAPDPGPLRDFVVERCWETDQSVMARRLALLESFDATDRLWQLDAPTLVLAGSRDAIVPAARQEALARGIPGARFATLDGAGHIGFLTHRDEVAAHVGALTRERRRSLC